MTEFVGNGSAGPSTTELARNMRNPLSVILNAAHLLALSRDDATAARVRLIVVRQVERLSGLVDELDELLRAEHGAPADSTDGVSAPMR